MKTIRSMNEKSLSTIILELEVLLELRNNLVVLFSDSNEMEKYLVASEQLDKVLEDIIIRLNNY